MQKAAEHHAPLVLAEDMSYCRQHETDKEIFTLYPKHEDPFDLICPLTGHYQEANICTVFATFRTLKPLLPALEDGHLAAGIRHVVKNTGLRGRWEILRQHPTLICDIGHNAHGFRRIMDSIRAHPHERLFMVLGFVNDKDLGPVLSQLPPEAHYVFTRSSSERSIPAEELSVAAAAFSLQGQTVPGVKEAVQTALDQARPGDLVFLGGSTFVVADYLEA